MLQAGVVGGGSGAAAGDAGPAGVVGLWRRMGEDGGGSNQHVDSDLSTFLPFNLPTSLIHSTHSTCVSFESNLFNL